MVIKAKNISKLIFLSILFSPVIWLLGIGVFYFHLLSLLCFIFDLGLAMKSSLKNELLLQDFINKTLFIYILIYFISLVFAFFEGAPIIRISSSLFNFSYWIMCLFIISFISKYSNLDSIKILTDKIWILPLLVGIASIISLVVYKNSFHNIFLNSPISVLLNSLNLPDLIKHSTRINLVSQDWVLGDRSLRTSILGIYPTASGAVMLLTIPIIFYQFIDQKKIHYLFSTIFGIIAILLTASRTSIVAIFIGIFGSYIICKQNRTLIIIFILILILISSPILIDIFSYLVSYRSGSSITRFSLYFYGFELTNKTNILFGLGYKPRIEQFFIPIGSHSTYIGAYIKTGLLGFTIILIWQIAILRLWIANCHKINQKYKSLFMGVGSSIISMVLWMLTEDIDAPQLVMFTYATLVGLLIAIVKNKVFKPPLL